MIKNIHGDVVFPVCLEDVPCAEYEVCIKRLVANTVRYHAQDDECVIELVHSLLGLVGDSNMLMFLKTFPELNPVFASILQAYANRSLETRGLMSCIVWYKLNDLSNFIEKVNANFRAQQRLGQDIANTQTAEQFPVYKGDIGDYEPGLQTGIIAELLVDRAGSGISDIVLRWMSKFLKLEDIEKLLVVTPGMAALFTDAYLCLQRKPDMHKSPLETEVWKRLIDLRDQTINKNAELEKGKSIAIEKEESSGLVVEKDELAELVAGIVQHTKQKDVCALGLLSHVIKAIGPSDLMTAVSLHPELIQVLYTWIEIMSNWNTTQHAEYYELYSFIGQFLQDNHNDLICIKANYDQEQKKAVHSSHPEEMKPIDVVPFRRIDEIIKLDAIVQPGSIDNTVGAMVSLFRSMDRNTILWHIENNKEFRLVCQRVSLYVDTLEETKQTEDTRWLRERMKKDQEPPVQQNEHDGEAVEMSKFELLDSLVSRIKKEAINPIGVTRESVICSVLEMFSKHTIDEIVERCRKDESFYTILKAMTTYVEQNPIRPDTVLDSLHSVVKRMTGRSTMVVGVTDATPSTIDLSKKRKASHDSRMEVLLCCPTFQRDGLDVKQTLKHVVCTGPVDTEALILDLMEFTAYLIKSKLATSNEGA